MNDRFKFRVWAKPHEPTKTEGYYVDDADYMVMTPDGEVQIEYYCDNGYDGYTESFEQDEIIIEQCTGLKDKNGKLIFEKDIVKITDKSSRKEPFIGVVEYTNTASFEANCNGFYMHLHNPKTPENVSMVEKMFCTSIREIEVVGNIHNNHELLEQSNE